MHRLIIATDQTDANGDCIIHERKVTQREAFAVLTQCNTGVDYLVFSASDGDHAVKLMDVHAVTVE